MVSILESLRPVIDSANFVRIDDEALTKFCNTLRESELTQAQAPYYSCPEGSSREQDVALSIVFNALNFCFWGEPKWKATIDWQEYSGSEGTVKSLIHSVQNGLNILNPQILKNLTEEQLHEVFKGNTVIPLFAERLSLLRDLGTVVLEKYDGKFSLIIDQAAGDALKIIELLATDFPKVFNDVAMYRGHQVQFFKRAQLVPIDLYLQSLMKPNFFTITNIEHMTALADYNIPMVLREYGIVVYAPELAHKIDNKIEIDSGSEEEIEIRASMIWSIEKMKLYLQKKFPLLTASQVSDIFWFRRKEFKQTGRPPHRTRTIWY